MITYNTNISNKKFHDLDTFQSIAEEYTLGDSIDDDEDDLFEIEDVDTEDYNKSNTAQNPVGSLPSLMLDSTVSSDEESEYDSEFDDMASDLDFSTEVVINNDWNQSAVLSPYLTPKNNTNNKKSQQLTFDSILSSSSFSNNNSSSSTIAAVNNYNLWLSAN